MRRAIMKKPQRFAFALMALAGILLAASWLTPAKAEEPRLPIVYVHGGAGSGAQYETQAMRFSSNNYPNVVRAIDRKLFRDVLRMKGQIIAICVLIACGVGSFVTSSRPGSRLS